MRKTDISKYTEQIDVNKKEIGAKDVLSYVWKVAKTFLAIMICAGICIGVSMSFYIFKLRKRLRIK